MTALPDWLDVGTTDTDAELVRASLTGDKNAFGRMYDRYADRLHDFCIGMLGDREAAADCVQDVFCTAASRLAQLRDPDRLRPWLYSIARNEAMRRLRDRRRETPSDELPETATAEASPETLAARTELADLIAEAAGGLSDRDRSVLELAFRHGFDGSELAAALGVTPTYAHTITHRLRETIERSLGALLVSRHARRAGACPELAMMLKDWDGHFNVLMRKRISRHIESCSVCDDQRRRLVSPAALLGVTPAFIPAPEWLRGKTVDKIDLPDPRRDGGADAAEERRQSRRGLYAIAMALAVLGAAGGLTFLWLNREPIAIDTTEISETLPMPSPTTAPTNPPPMAPGTASKSPDSTPSVLAPPTTSTTPPAPVPPPVNDSPPVIAEPTPVVTPFEPPPVAPPPSVNRRAQSTPTSAVRPPSIVGVPQNPATQQPTRRTSINLPSGGSTGRAGGGDSDSGGSTRRGTGRS